MSDMKLNKLKLYASIDTSEPTNEVAYALSIPDLELRQPDLQYISAVFVSSGFNLNSAFFLPSELIKSRYTISEKPLDVEHEQESIVGHLSSYAFAHKDGSVFDPEELLNQVGSVDINKIPMDILVGARLYKARFPEVAEEVISGKYCVSMECYYRDFDIIIDNIIIPKVEATEAGLIPALNSIIKVVEGKEDRGVHRVGRVLRGMLFSGCGLVESPANPGSVILETAEKEVSTGVCEECYFGFDEFFEAAKKNSPHKINSDIILDLTKVDSYMKAKREKESIVIHGLSNTESDSAYLSSSYGGIHRHEVLLDSNETLLDGAHFHIVLPEDVPDGYHIYFVEDGAHRHPFNSGKASFDSESDHVHKFYVEYMDNDSYKVRAYETSVSKKAHTHELTRIDVDETRKGPTKGNYGSTSRSGAHYHVLSLDGGISIKTIMPKDILKMEKDESSANQTIGPSDGVDRKGEPEICVSFNRYVYERGGDDPGKPSNVSNTPGMVEQVESLPIPPIPGGGGEITQQDKIKHENWCSLFDVGCTTPGGQAVHPDCLRLVLDRTTKEAVRSFLERVKDNRKKKGIEIATSSLNETVKLARKSFLQEKEED